MSDFLNMVAEVGRDNVVVLMDGHPLHEMFFIAYTSSSDTPIPNVPFVIDEDRHKLKDGHKVGFRPLCEGIARENFYVSDFEALVKQGHVRLLIDAQYLALKEQHNMGGVDTFA